MPNSPPRHTQRRALILGLGLGLTQVLAGCSALRPAPPEPTETPIAPFAARPLPTATPTPTPEPSATPLPPELALATLAALLPPTPTAGPVSLPAATLPASACTIPKIADSYALAPAPEAPEAARADWAAQAAPALTAEVLGYDAEARRYALRAVDPAAEHGFVLSHSGDPLPIETGKTYRFTVHQDLPDRPPAGHGLKIEDEAGLVFLGISVREGDGSARRVLDGDRGGLTIYQLPTLCTQTEASPCGIELRAAPVEVSQGDQVLSLNPGETGVLATDPPYEVRLLSSHYRRWLGDVPCADPTDWVLAYRVARVALPGPTP
jgi:hypothetical protein